MIQEHRNTAMQAKLKGYHEQVMDTLIKMAWMTHQIFHWICKNIH